MHEFAFENREIQQQQKQRQQKERAHTEAERIPFLSRYTLSLSRIHRDHSLPTSFLPNFFDMRHVLPSPTLYTPLLSAGATLFLDSPRSSCARRARTGCTSPAIWLSECIVCVYVRMTVARHILSDIGNSIFLGKRRNADSFGARELEVVAKCSQVTLYRRAEREVILFNE